MHHFKVAANWFFDYLPESEIELKLSNNDALNVNTEVMKYILVIRVNVHHTMEKLQQTKTRLKPGMLCLICYSDWIILLLKCDRADVKRRTGRQTRVSRRCLPCGASQPGSVGPPPLSWAVSSSTQCPSVPCFTAPQHTTAHYGTRDPPPRLHGSTAPGA